MTESHAWYSEHVEAYALRHLGADDERAFRTHLEHCAECQAELLRTERDLSWLPMGVQPVSMRPGLARSLTRQVLHERTLRWQDAVPWALAASVALVAGIGVLRMRASTQDSARQLAAAESSLAAVRDTLSVLRNTQKVMHASVKMGGQEGGITILADPVSHRWNVVVHDLPALPPGEQYQFWFITDDGMVRGARLGADPGTSAVLTVGMPSEGGNVLGAALSVEPANVTSGPPQGEVLAHLML